MQLQSVRSSFATHDSDPWGSGAPEYNQHRVARDSKLKTRSHTKKPGWLIRP